MGRKDRERKWIEEKRRENKKSKTMAKKQTTQTVPPESKDKNSKSHYWWYCWRAFLWLSGGFLAMIGFFPLIADSILTKVTPLWLFGFIFLASCAWLCNLLWIITKWINKWKPINKKVRITTTVILATGIIGSLSPYSVGYFMSRQGTIEMDNYGNDATPVSVYYGNRKNDFFWTQTTVGKLKSEPVASLFVDNKEIFKIHTDGRAIFVDAVLFESYGGKKDDNFTIQLKNEFSFGVSGFMNTTAPRDGSKKYYVRKGQNFGMVLDQYEDGAIASYYSNNGVLTTQNVFNQVVIKNNWGEMPKGWNIRQLSFEVTNENNIPMLSVKYKSPYEITVTGIFVTPYGILKVDNNPDVIFDLFDYVPELGTYTIDRVLPPRTLFDLITTERKYILFESVRGE